MTEAITVACVSLLNSLKRLRWFFWEMRAGVGCSYSSSTAAKSTAFLEKKRRPAVARVALRLTVVRRSLCSGAAKRSERCHCHCCGVAPAHARRCAPATRAAKRRPDWPCWERLLRAPGRSAAAARASSMAALLLMLSMGDTMTRLAQWRQKKTEKAASVM